MAPNEASPHDPLRHWSPLLRRLVELGWAAGFVDGEGCLSLIRTVRPGRAYPTYQLLLQVSQNRLDVLQRLQRILGCGKIYVVPRKAGQRRDSYTLVVHGKHAVRVVSTLKPFLRRKRAEALVCLKAWFKGKMFLRPGARGFSSRTWKLREKLYFALRRLK